MNLLLYQTKNSHKHFQMNLKFQNQNLALLTRTNNSYENLNKISQFQNTSKYDLNFIKSIKSNEFEFL